MLDSVCSCRGGVSAESWSDGGSLRHSGRTKSQARDARLAVGVRARRAFSTRTHTHPHAHHRDSSWLHQRSHANIALFHQPLPARPGRHRQAQKASKRLQNSVRMALACHWRTPEVHCCGRCRARLRDGHRYSHAKGYQARRTPIHHPSIATLFPWFRAQLIRPIEHRPRVSLAPHLLASLLFPGSPHRTRVSSSNTLAARPGRASPCILQISRPKGGTHIFIFASRDCHSR